VKYSAGVSLLTFRLLPPCTYDRRCRRRHVPLAATARTLEPLEFVLVEYNKGRSPGRLSPARSPQQRSPESPQRSPQHQLQQLRSPPGQQHRSPHRSPPQAQHHHHHHQHPLQQQLSPVRVGSDGGLDGWGMPTSGAEGATTPAAGAAPGIARDAKALELLRACCECVVRRRACCVFSIVCLPAVISSFSLPKARVELYFLGRCHNAALLLLCSLCAVRLFFLHAKNLQKLTTPINLTANARSEEDLIRWVHCISHAISATLNAKEQ
jgi:hypothetical protein